MRTAQDRVLNLRLPAETRAFLDDEARAAGLKISVVARNALAVGLQAIRQSPSDPSDPPPAGPAAQMPVAA